MVSTHHPSRALPVPRRRRLGRAGLEFTGLTQNLGHPCGSYIGISRQTVGSTCEFWVDPCEFYVAAALGLEVLAEPVARRHRDRHRHARSPLAIGRDVILTAALGLLFGWPLTETL
jgi:hypothetical protein